MMRLTIFIISMAFALHGNGQESIRKAGQTMLKKSVFEKAYVGIQVRHLASGDILYAHQAGHRFLPASNVKILTAAAAWDILGPDYRFFTAFSTFGNKIDSVFYGEILISGNGDPTLGSGRFGAATHPDSILLRWHDQLYNAGIRAIAGYIRIEPDRFECPQMPLTWEWGDFGGCYGTGYWPVNWRDNCVSVQMHNEPTGVKMYLDSIRMPWIVQWQHVPEKNDNPSYVLRNTDFPRYMVGMHPDVTFPVRTAVSLPDAPGFLKEFFPGWLQRKGMPFSAGPANIADFNWQLTDTLWSPPLRDILNEVIGESRNMYAEGVLYAIGRKSLNSASTDTGLKAISNWLKKNNLNEKDAWLFDGSGMSRQNALTPELICEVLAYMAKNKQKFEGFRMTFATPMTKGTLADRISSKKLQKNLFAKTGSLNKVRSLSGYIRTAQGEWLAFSILTNHTPGKPKEFYAAIEPFLETLYEYRKE